MTRRIRCDSKLQGLPEAQRVRVDVWLFEEGRTYEEVVEGCLEEFGLKVSRSSVGRYYERISANRFAKVQREKRMALEPVLSPAEAYKELLRRIAELALEEMDQPLKDINHKVVVRLVRVLIAARREKHMETRVWVERRKAENWLAREVLRACLKIARAPAARNSGRSKDGEAKASPQRIVTVDQTPTEVERPAARRVFAQKAVWLRCSSVEDPPGIFSFVAPRHPAFCPKTGAPGIFRKAPRHWRRTMKKQAHVSYLPIWREGKQEQQNMGRAASKQLNAAESAALKRHECRAPQRRGGDGPLEEPRLMARLAPNQVNAVENLTLKRHECRASGGDAYDPQKQGQEKSGSQQNPLNHFALDRGQPLVGTLATTQHG